jgi:hypothetical protein
MNRHFRWMNGHLRPTNPSISFPEATQQSSTRVRFELHEIYHYALLLFLDYFRLPGLPKPAHHDRDSRPKRVFSGSKKRYELQRMDFVTAGQQRAAHIR